MNCSQDTWSPKGSFGLPGGLPTSLLYLPAWISCSDASRAPSKRRRKVYETLSLEHIISWSVLCMISSSSLEIFLSFSYISLLSLFHFFRVVLSIYRCSGKLIPCFLILIIFDRLLKWFLKLLWATSSLFLLTSLTICEPINKLSLICKREPSNFFNSGLLLSKKFKYMFASINIFFHKAGYQLNLMNN